MHTDAFAQVPPCRPHLVLPQCPTQGAARRVPRVAPAVLIEAWLGALFKRSKALETLLKRRKHSWSPHQKAFSTLCAGGAHRGLAQRRRVRPPRRTRQEAPSGDRGQVGEEKLPGGDLMQLIKKAANVPSDSKAK